MKTVTLRNIHIGQGKPKVIVPIAEQTLGDITAGAKRLKDMPLDGVEWRGDFFEGICHTENVLKVLGELRGILGDIPLIFTCRTSKEGGRAEISDEEYALLNRAAAGSGHADGTDIEALSHGDVTALIKDIQQTGCRVIGSHHMTHTPAQAEMLEIFRRIAASGADIAKLAVYADSVSDAIGLMKAAKQAKQQGISPIIPIAMGEQGIISRIAGELFGADAAFAAVGRGSAQGQLSLEVMNMLLRQVHENIG